MLEGASEPFLIQPPVPMTSHLRLGTKWRCRHALPLALHSQQPHLRGQPAPVVKGVAQHQAGDAGGQRRHAVLLDAADQLTMLDCGQAVERARHVHVPARAEAARLQCGQPVWQCWQSRAFGGTRYRDLPTDLAAIAVHGSRVCTSSRACISHAIIP